MHSSESLESALSSPFRNFTIETYPQLQKIHKKLSNCGSNFITLLNKESKQEVSMPLFCDNRVCLNPECKKHRFYKYMKEHGQQINELNKDIKAPKGWVFTDEKRIYPIDKKYCQRRLKFLYELLDLKKHRKYGSSSKYSIHMEIKLSSDSWYLHFHGVSGGITNLRLIRRLWCHQILYENAVKPKELGYYVSKYASKVPVFPDKRAYLEYMSAVYKLQMHRFNACGKRIIKESSWELIGKEFNSCQSKPFFELCRWLDDYLNDFGYGG